jgi:hypothetical protein
MQLLQDVRSSLGSIAKDVLTMLRLLSLDFITPQHVRAFLEALEEHDGAHCT